MIFFLQNEILYNQKYKNKRELPLVYYNRWRKIVHINETEEICNYSMGPTGDHPGNKRNE